MLFILTAFLIKDMPPTLDVGILLITGTGLFFVLHFRHKHRLKILKVIPEFSAKAQNFSKGKVIALDSVKSKEAESKTKEPAEKTLHKEVGQ